MILLHQPFVHLSDPLHILVGLTGGAVAAAAHRAYRSTAGCRRPLVLVKCRRCSRVQGFGCDAVEAEPAQEVRHVAHVHLRELLHVLSQVVSLHLRSEVVIGGLRPLEGRRLLTLKTLQLITYPLLTSKHAKVACDGRFGAIRIAMRFHLKQEIMVDFVHFFFFLVLF